MNKPNSPDHQVMELAHGKPVKMWTVGVPVEEDARRQLQNTARMPFVFRHLAVMPDVHLGKGSTIGTVIPTQGAIIPAAVGVDIGCGMMAARTTLKAADLPDSLHGLRGAIERAVPHGRAPGRRDPGAWGERAPHQVDDVWKTLLPGFDRICQKYPKLARTNNHVHLGTLGTVSRTANQMPEKLSVGRCEGPSQASCRPLAGGTLGLVPA